tara:strand:- start:320 stop:625 length:306 start_codon:yes stop_codon:yes gene_type:complete
MKITKRQLRRIIREEKQKLQEAYPVAGESSNAWIAFEKAVEDAAIPMIDAGMEMDGVLQAMHDSIDNIFAEWEDEPEWDEADQDNANQEYINRYGDPYENN